MKIVIGLICFFTLAWPRAAFSQFPKAIKTPAGAPNIVLIVLDDAGFGQFHTFGGGVPSLTMDRLAARGLRYNRFHTTGLNSSTHASLLTGRNQHAAAPGGVTDQGIGYEDYTSILPKSCGTLAEVLRQNGYATAWIGKNDNVQAWETSPLGPFDHWANGLGFDYFYGYNGSDISQWEPLLFENRNLVEPYTEPGYYLTTDLADKAVTWIQKTKSIAPNKPIFLYVAPGATHAPHHAPKEWIEKFRGAYDMGWGKYREETFERQKKLGVIPAHALLTPRPESLPTWESLNKDQRHLYAHMMEVFAAYGSYCDGEMGRIVDAVKQLPDSDNTVMIYIAGSNGASAEGGPDGSLDNMLPVNGIPEKWQDNMRAMNDLGSNRYYNTFPAGWAWAVDAPFQWTKQVAGYFGGIRNPMIVDWPARIKDMGGLRSQFAHVIDIVPTIYEICGITSPAEINGVAQKPIEGASFAYTFDSAKAADRHTLQYFEVGANRGIYSNGWMASALAFPPWQPVKDIRQDKQKWELYNINEDFTQAINLAKHYQDKLKRMQDLWYAEAVKYQVPPAERLSVTAGRKSFTYYAGMNGLREACSPPILNRSWTITADINVIFDKPSGVIITQGGMQGGYAVYVRDGIPIFVYNYLGLERTCVTGNQALHNGKNKIVVEFDYDGEGPGKGGSVKMSGNGAVIAKGRLQRTIPVQYSSTEGLDIGEDRGSSIDGSYTLPFEFTGIIYKVRVDLE